MSEKNIESYLRKKVSDKKGLALKLIPAGLAGIPDRLVLMPGGRLFFVELKAPRKEPRALQRYTHKLIENLGFMVFVIDSKEAVNCVLKEMEDYEVYTSQISANSNK